MSKEYTILQGDNLALLRAMPDESVSSCVTDPPYGLSREPDMAEVLKHWLAGDDYTHGSSGFMGRAWDSFVPGPAVWREVLRVLKPGGHVFAFSGTRTYDIAVLAMRLAGFEIRDQFAWVYGSGMPKSRNIAKTIDSGGGRTEDIRRMEMGDAYTPSGRGRVNYDHGGGSAMNGAETGEWEPKSEEAKRWNGWGTGAKPAWEPIVLARKPFKGSVAKNVLKHGTGALNIDACRISLGDAIDAERYRLNCSGDRGHDGTRESDEAGATDMRTGGGKAAAGRWPANLLHDGSDEVLAAFPADAGGHAPVTGDEPSAASTGTVTNLRARVASEFIGDTGSAARFFYCGKASTAEREAGLESMPMQLIGRGNNAAAGELDAHGKGGFNRVQQRRNTHPTVKPIAVGRWLQRLITPPGGVTLDLYAGSGSFGASALLEGFRPILLELDRDAEGKPLGYIDLIRGKCEWALLERAREAEVRAVADREADFRAKQIALFGAAA